MPASMQPRLLVVMYFAAVSILLVLEMVLWFAAPLHHQGLTWRLFQSYIQAFPLPDEPGAWAIFPAAKDVGLTYNAYTLTTYSILPLAIFLYAWAGLEWYQYSEIVKCRWSPWITADLLLCWSMQSLLLAFRLGLVDNLLWLSYLIAWSQAVFGWSAAHIAFNSQYDTLRLSLRQSIQLQSHWIAFLIGACMGGYAYSKLCLAASSVNGALGTQLALHGLALLLLWLSLCAEMLFRCSSAHKEIIFLCTSLVQKIVWVGLLY